MKVIVLMGPSSCGKSHTINMVHHLLLDDKYVAVSYNFRILGNPEQNDFIDILIKNDLKIGIFSMGDYAIGKDSVGNLLRQLEEANCNYVFCACTIDKQGTQDAVNRYTDLQKINKEITSNVSQQAGANFSDAKKMLQESSLPTLKRFC
jgi:hypothetical protein